MDKEKILKLLADAVNRNVMVYDGMDENGEFTLRLARLMIDHAKQHSIIPEVFILPANDAGFKIFEKLRPDIHTHIDYPTGLDGLKIYNKKIHFILEAEYDELITNYISNGGTFPRCNSNLCLCGNEEKMLLGSF